jgi:hypothetical protein
MTDLLPVVSFRHGVNSISHASLSAGPRRYHRTASANPQLLVRCRETDFDSAHLGRELGNEQANRLITAGKSLHIAGDAAALAWLGRGD